MSTASQSNHVDHENLAEDDHANRVMGNLLSKNRVQDLIDQDADTHPETQAAASPEAQDEGAPAGDLTDIGLAELSSDLLSTDLLVTGLEEKLDAPEDGGDSLTVELAVLDSGGLTGQTVLDGSADAFGSVLGDSLNQPLQDTHWASFGTNAITGPEASGVQLSSYQWEPAPTGNFGVIEELDFAGPPEPHEFEQMGCACACCLSVQPGDSPIAGAMDSGNVGAPAPAAALSTLARYLSEYNAGGAGNDFWDDFWGGLTPQGWAPNFHWNLTNSGLDAKNGVLTYNVMGSWYDADGLTDDGADATSKINAIRHALNVYEDMLGINFVETTATAASAVDIAFGNESSGSAFANFNADGKTTDGNASGIISNAWINIAENWSGNGTIGDYYFHTALHEIGHALGLGHQGNYNAGQGSLTYANQAQWQNDTIQYTMMSYWNQSNYTAPGESTPSGAFLGDVNVIGPQAVDWLALDRMYGGMGHGLSDGITTSNTTWGFNSTWVDWTPTSSGPAFGYANTAYASLDTLLATSTVTIVDAGGTDTLDMSGFANNTKIDIGIVSASDTTPSFSNVAGLTGNLMIGVGTVIENVVGGAGSELINGNSVNNNLQGGAGNDTILGLGGNDTLIGGLGNDSLLGGAGNDVFEYFAGNHLNETINGEAGTDKILLSGLGTFNFNGIGTQLFSIEEIEFNADVGGTKIANFSIQEFDNTVEVPANLLIDSSGGNIDILNFFATGSLFATTNWSGWTFQDWDDTLDQINVTLGGALTNFTGTIQRDNIQGASAAEVINGVGDNDTIDGGGGNDTIDGGLGNDSLLGGSGDDSIDGGDGNDTLNGGSGADSTDGGTGNDLVVDDDFVNFDVHDGGAGIDTIDYSLITFASGLVTINLATGQTVVSGGNTETISNFENVEGSQGGETIIGDGNDNLLSGNGGNDSILGGSGADTLLGGDGNDTLFGENGIDSLNGGAGDDVLGNLGFEFIDDIFGGAGMDTLDMSGYLFNFLTVDLGAGTYTVGGGAGTQTLDSIEYVIGMSSDDSLTGGAGDETLLGEDGNDTLAGGGGADLLGGGNGNDSLLGDAGNDTLVGASGNDTLEGGLGDDQLLGGADNDTLIDNVAFETGGNDTFNGGSGIDTLIADATWTDSVLFDLAAGGTWFSGTQWDTIFSIENLVLGGGADAIGNGANNRIEATDNGFTNSNSFSGGAGHDTLIGGLGNDSLLGETGNDLLIGGSGADTMHGGTGIDTLSYYGEAVGVSINLLANAASGGVAAGDVISGFENVNLGNGDDFGRGNLLDNVINGYAGNDTLVGLGGNDTLRGGSGDDLIYGDAGVDVLIGQSGNDTIDYGPDTVGVTVRLWNNFVDGGIATGDTIGGFENASGGSGNDVLEGTLGDNFLLGRNGNDTINGLGGNDTINGGGGNDLIISRLGGETLNGWTGFDRIAYGGSTSGVSVDLQLNTASGGFATGDIISNFEAASGSVHADTLKGNAGNNVLLGLGGNDTLNGRLGNDTIFGGAGEDYILGAGGNDRLLGQTQADTLIGAEGNDTLIGGTGGDTFLFGGAFDQDEISDFGFADVARLVGMGAGFNSFADYDVNSDGLVNAVDAGLTAKVVAGPGGDLTLLFDAGGTRSIFFDNVGFLNSGDLDFV